MTLFDILAVAGASLGAGQDVAVPWARIVIAFLFCIGVAVLAIAVLRSRSGQGAFPALEALVSRTGGGPRELHLIERLSLSPTSQLLLVQCGAERLLILTSSTGAQVVRAWDDEADGGDGV